jgi:hypothetical protein
MSAGKKLLWIRALLRIAGHPVHLAVKPATQPFFQATTLIEQRPGTHNAYFMKAELECVGLY